MPSTPTWSSAAFLVEAPESGAIQSDSRGTSKTQVFHGSLAQCEASVVPYGTLGTNVYAGYICDRCIVTPGDGASGRLDIVWLRSVTGGGGGDGEVLPPDEFDLTPVDANPRIERHAIFHPDPDDPDKIYLTSFGIRQVINTFQKDYPLDAAGEAKRAADYNALTALQKKLYDKLADGIESYPFTNWSYIWTSFSWTIPSMSLGNYRQTPWGPLAGFLYSGTKWLRQPDSLSVRNGVYALTRVWIGAPEWDSDLYPKA